MIVSARHADISNGENIVVYDLNMDIDKGDFIYITGKVGTGKTSIFRTFIAENLPLGGSVSVCGQKIEEIHSKDIAKLRRKVGVVFQDLQLLKDRNVHDNLEFVLKATGWKDAKRIEEKITEVLEQVGMSTKSHRTPQQLSGGEQQRICIARALLNSPELILADEPTGNLDTETADGIMQLFLRLNREEGTAIAMITHDRTILSRYPATVYVCEKESCTKVENNADSATTL